MNLLLDTHTLLWLLDEHEKLSKKVSQKLADTSNHLYVSIASLWETTIKIMNNRLPAHASVDDFLQEIKKHPITVLNIDEKYLQTLAALPFHHKEPFDRIILSTAITEDMVLITKDEDIKKYDVETLW